jgi:hypothetical protein
VNIRDTIRLIEENLWDLNSILLELFDTEKFLSRAKGVQALFLRGASEGEKDAARLAMARMLDRAKEEAADLSPQEQKTFWARFDAIRNETTIKAEPANGRRPGASSGPRPRPQWKYEEPPKKDEYKYDPNKRYSNFKVGDIIELGGNVGEIVAQLPPAMDRDMFKVRWLTGPKTGTETAVSHVNLRRYDAKKSSGSGEEQRNTSSGGAGDAKDMVIKAYAEFQEGTSDKVYGIVLSDNRYFTFWGRNGGGLATKMQDNFVTAQSIFDGKIRKGYRERFVSQDIDRMIRRNIKL